jgi:hypothetical protein
MDKQAYLLLGIKEKDQQVVSDFFKDYKIIHEGKMMIYENKTTGEIVSVLNASEPDSDGKYTKKRIHVYSCNNEILTGLLKKLTDKTEARIFDK